MDKLLIQCDCDSFEIVELGWFDDEPKTFYLTITVYPKTLLDKIKGIWKVLKGTDYGITDEVLINKKEAKKMCEWLKKRV